MIWINISLLCFSVSFCILCVSVALYLRPSVSLSLAVSLYRLVLYSVGPCRSVSLFVSESLSVSLCLSISLCLDFVGIALSLLPKVVVVLLAVPSPRSVSW